MAVASSSETQNIRYILAKVETCPASAAYPPVPALVRKSIGDDPEVKADHCRSPAIPDGVTTDRTHAGGETWGRLSTAAVRRETGRLPGGGA